MSTQTSEAALLTFLSSSPEAVITDTYPWSESNKFDHATVVGAIKSLLVDQYVTAENVEKSFYTLTKEGESIVSDGSQEVLVLKALNEAGKLSIADLQTKVGKNVAKIGMGNCMKAKWVKKDGPDLVPLKKDDEVEDTVQKILQTLKEADFRPDALSDKVSLIKEIPSYNIFCNFHYFKR
ncbi:MAG: phenylalanyl-tRNA synthetase alpha chain [Bacillariaceae sp.]|jgi:phenylalanyl-tRNA synthetase alpha chain